MRIYNTANMRDILEYIRMPNTPPMVMTKRKGKVVSCEIARLPKPQHLQYSKAVATLCDAVQEYGAFLGSDAAREKYDKAISAARNLQAQAVIQSNMAI